MSPERFLIQTKLHRPTITKRVIERPKLFNQLTGSLDCPITLISAPAGFGKTTLVSIWIESLLEKNDKYKELSFTWLSVDKNDNDLNTFLHYFIAAISSIYPESFPDTLLLLGSSQNIPFSLLFSTLINEIDSLPGRFVIVIDDFHIIKNETVYEFLNEIIRNFPQSMHLVLITRNDPPIPLISLRAKGLICEIRSNDLSFDKMETDLFLDLTVDHPLSQNDRDLIYLRTEGWVAGLRLAALSLQSRAEKENVFSHLSNPDANITNYLIEEVLLHQLPAVAKFLITTSMLDRFNLSLCEVVMDETDPAWSAGACLEWINRADLFIIPLDESAEWYRYHHLFQEILKKILFSQKSADQIAVLNRKVALWFEKHDMMDQALEYALLSQDRDLVEHLLIAGLNEILNTEDRRKLKQWMGRLPEELTQQSAGLLILKAFSIQFLWQLGQQEKLINQVESLLKETGAIAEPEKKIIRGLLFSMKAQKAYFNNQITETIDFCRQVLDLLPDSWKYVCGGATFYLGLAMQANGQGEAAEDMLLEKYEAYINKLDIYALFILQTLGFIYLLMGKTYMMKLTAHLFFEGAYQSGLPIKKSWANYYLGILNYHLGEVKIAARYFRTIIKNRYVFQISNYRDAVAGLALMYQTSGRASDAKHLLDEVSKFDLEQTGSEDIRTISLKARLALLQGDIEEACELEDRFAEPLPSTRLLWFDEPSLTQIRILIANGEKNNLQKALKNLDILEETTTATHNLLHQIHILVLRALTMEAQGNLDHALSTLTQAIELASSGNFIRLFVDEGTRMQDLLIRLSKQLPDSGYIARILNAFFQDEVYKNTSQSIVQMNEQNFKNREASLTAREREILILISKNQSNKEIGETLNITESTVKRHIFNIFVKMNVNRRKEAIKKAIELGILDNSTEPA